MTTVSSRARRFKKVKPPLDPQTFNREFLKDEEEIVRIFKHLFQKYPIGGRPEEAFNHLFVALYELRVLQKWSVAKVVRAEVKRRTGSAVEAQKVFKRLQEAGNDESEKIALEMGINLKAKRGQFLYKWVEQILGHEYRSEGLRMRRFMKIRPVMSDPESWNKCRREDGFTPWAIRKQDASLVDLYQGAGVWGVSANHDTRQFPHFEDVPTCVGEHTYEKANETPLSDAIEDEILRGIQMNTDHADRFILAKKAQGYSVREIQEAISQTPGFPPYSHQTINTRVKKIRTKPTTRRALQ